MSRRPAARRRASQSLPSWDLSDLYAGIADPKIERDLKRAKRQARSFAARYQGELAKLSGAALATSISEYESLSENLSRVICFAQLLFAANTGDQQIAAFYQTMHERVNTISSQVLFFELEFNRLPARTLKRQLANPKASRYRPWIDACRDFRDHQLSGDLERLLHEKQVAGRASWSRLFDETMSGMRFALDGKSLTGSDVLNCMSSPDGALRKRAAQAFGKGLGDNIRLFALITNTLAKDKSIEDEWRGYKRPDSKMNLGNQVEDEVVDALAAAVRGSNGDLSHRYYSLKAKWMGRRKLDYWDRNAPLPDEDTAAITWAGARKTVLQAYGAFEPKLASLAAQFFDKRWIDADPRPGKDSGAFSHPTIPSVHPYVLMNFHGKVRDVMTLAHELGHGVHQLLAAPQGQLMSDTPLTLAETASVFGEMLTFRSLLDREKDPARRRILLASKVEDMLNTVVRQVAFYEFERRVHDERRAGELSAERLGDIWMAVQTDSLGPVFRFGPEYRNYWAYIPHFIHSPFYVYAYAFGDCLVNSLYDVYQSGHPDFRKKYLAMLSAGGTLRHKALLAPFGLDASDPGFWQRGLGVVSGFIDEIELSLRTPRGRR